MIAARLAICTLKTAFIYDLELYEQDCSDGALQSHIRLVVGLTVSIGLKFLPTLGSGASP